MLSEYFSNVVGGKILRTNIKRGSVWNGKKLGSKSPDSTYALVGLFPQVGSRPSPGENQKVSGPVMQWDQEFKVVRKVYTVLDIPAEVLAEKESSKAKADLELIDRKSIRSIREFIIAKYGNDPLMPEYLKAHEADAIEKRKKVV